MSDRWENEAALVAAVSRWLTDSGWTPYHEVTTGGGCPRADIVATRGPLIWVIEAKLSLSLAVMAQGKRWVGRSHLVSVAVPQADRGSNARDYAIETLAEQGIGLIFALFTTIL